MKPSLLLVLALSACALPELHSQSDASTPEAVAAGLSERVLDGASRVRVKMDFLAPEDGKKTVLQLVAVARRTKQSSETRYEVLWPKERKGEGFVIRKPAGQVASGSVFNPPDTLKSLSPSQLSQGIFGSALSYADLVENFFAWERQKLVGAETFNRIPCQILESRPGKSDQSIYGSVRTWVDTRRMVPLKIEKFGTDGKLVRRITTTLVAKDDRGREIPANVSVEQANETATTTIEGSNITHEVSLTDADFSESSLRPKR